MSVNKFKVGDTVVRTNKSYWPEQYGIEGVQYEVLELSHSGGIVVFQGGFGADPKRFDLVTTDNNNSKDTTTMTTSKFTETVTTTKTTIKGVIDGSLSNGAYISIDPIGHTINLVVGAKYCNQCASLFDKPSLQELINELQAVHDVMEEF
jgi:hypothetical protein